MAVRAPRPLFVKSDAEGTDGPCHTHVHERCFLDAPSADANRELPSLRQRTQPLTTAHDPQATNITQQHYPPSYHKETTQGFEEPAHPPTGGDAAAAVVEAESTPSESNADSWSSPELPLLLTTPTGSRPSSRLRPSSSGAVRVCLVQPPAPCDYPHV